MIGRTFGGSDKTFEVFPKVGDRRSYEDELLLIPPDEALLWLMEIEELQGAMEGTGGLEGRKVERLVAEFLSEEVAIRNGLLKRPAETARRGGATGAAPAAESAEAERSTIGVSDRRISR